MSITPEQMRELQEIGYHYELKHDLVRFPDGGSHCFVRTSDDRMRRRLTIDEQWQHAWDGHQAWKNYILEVNSKQS